jgi:tetratricopeptide (TPR) repeat protein
MALPKKPMCRLTLIGQIAVAVCWAALTAQGQTPATQPMTPAQVSERVLRFLEDRVKRDPDDMLALNRLAMVYLGRVRETGSIDYLRLADRDAKLSLAAVPADQNLEALLMQARVDFESHDFATARDKGKKLIRQAGDKSTSFAVLGDALLELGDYDGASTAYDEMQRIDPDSTTSLARLGRLDLLRGRTDDARELLSRARDAALELAEPSPEAVAWCRWQVGELFFLTGDYPAAEKADREALAGLPGYFRALASLGRALAAQGDVAGAIQQYEHAVAIIPDPSFVSALGDLYKLTGKDRLAQLQYKLVGQIAKISALHGAIYNRLVTLFRADHDIETDLAYADAVKEYEVRKDIYGADALAWCALKAGKLPEARAAVKESLKLGTPDAKLFYHAGMIALADGDAAKAAELLQKAVSMSPRFDPLQAPLCEKALEKAKAQLAAGRHHIRTISFT